MSELSVHLGTAASDGSAVTFDLRRAPHLLIAGTTGSGKSAAVHSILCSLLETHDSRSLGLVLIDPKRVELSDYAGLPHLCGPARSTRDRPSIARSPLDAIAALEWTLRAVEARFALMEAHSAKDISNVPQEALRGAGQPRSLLLVVDELADLMMASGSLTKAQRLRLTGPEITLARILQIGRAAGVHAVLATQRPSSDVITGVIKANVPSRLTFALQSPTDSRVAMGRRGAETLEGPGDALWLAADSRDAVRLQGRLVTDQERSAVVQRWVTQEAPRCGVAGQDGAVLARIPFDGWLRDVGLAPAL